MVATYSDKQILSTDPTYQNRVRQALVGAIISIKNEGTTVAYHRERETYGVQVMANPDNYKVIWAQAVSDDANVIGDATQGGTVVLTAANVAAQAALVTDAHLDAAISSDFNTFFRTPAN
jgi:hypothetical protein